MTVFQGSQDYDLLLRYTRGLRAGEVLHLPYPAYLWRRDGVSYSARYMKKATANARKALAERYEQGGQPLAVLPALNPDLHRPDFAGARQSWPSVSVIIPSRNAKALIEQVMQGLIEKTDYPDIEIIVVDNGSDDAEVLALYETWRAGPVPFRADIVREPFNFSRAVNRGVRQACGEALLLLNNDIEILSQGGSRRWSPAFPMQIRASWAPSFSTATARSSMWVSLPASGACRALVHRGRPQHTRSDGPASCAPVPLGCHGRVLLDLKGVLGKGRPVRRREIRHRL